MKKILELATRTKEQKLHKHEGTGQSTHPELATRTKEQKLYKHEGTRQSTHPELARVKTK